MYKRFACVSGLGKEQIKYVSLGTFIGFFGGATNFPLWFDIPILPVGNVLVSAYVFLTAYAIIKYRLMDIRVAVTSAGLFIGISTLALGVPFYLYAIGLHLHALMLGMALAAGAPFLYFRLQRQAADTILNEQREYQGALRKAAQEIGRLIKVDDIVRFVVDLFHRAIRVRGAAFYLYNGKDYILKHAAGDDIYAREIDGDGPAAGSFCGGSAVFLDELRGRAGDAGGSSQAEAFFRDNPAHVLMPVTGHDRAIGLVLLGEKCNNTPFSRDDLSVLASVAAHVATAIESAILFENARKTWDEQMHDHRLKDMGLVSAAISHQVGNRLQLVTRFLEAFAMRFKAEKTTLLTREELLLKLNRSMEQFPEIVDNAIKAAEISDALRVQGKLSQAAQAVTLRQLVRRARSIAEAKHPGFAYEFREDYDAGLTLWANEASMQDILFNLFDNSLDAIAIRMRAQDLPAGYAGRIEVRAQAQAGMARIVVEDNGIGFRPEALERVFVPHFTTKGTDKGTGLGLYIIHEFIRHNKGSIRVESEAGAWARFTIMFPLATRERLLADRRSLEKKGA